MKQPSLKAGAPATTPVLRTLGTLAIDGGDRAALATLLARPKPLAVLTYLTLSQGTGFHQRDTLLALFWPDSDEEHARSSLRQALYQVRRALGAHALVTRGGEVGLATGALACDAAEFADRIALGDRAGALATYGGDLLPGFFVEGAPAFARWLDLRRQQLRDAARSAASALADEAEAAGDAAGAVAWSRRAVALAPYDEPGVRRLVTLLVRAGDRAGALGAYRAFAQQLHDEYGLDPSAETAALVAGIEAPAEPGAPAPPSLHPRRVLVAVFENRTGSHAFDAFGRLVADAVAQGVTRLDRVEVVPLTAVLASARHAATVAGDDPPERRAWLAAEEMGAATVVSGTCYAAGDELVVQGWLGDVGSGRVLRALGPVRSPVASPFAAVEALREEACTGLAAHLETRVVHLRAARRAPSYDAYGDYVEGLTRFVEGDWRGALRHLERAATGDADYALPLIVAAIARWNLGELGAAEEAVARAEPLVRRGGPFERTMLDMVRAWLAGDWVAAYEAARRQSEIAPGSLGTFQVAEEARRRNRPAEAVRVLSTLDPSRGEMRGWMYYWVVLAQALHVLGEHRRELEAARQARVLFPESPLALRLEVHARAALGDVAGVHACIGESLATPTRQEPRAGALMREAALELRAHSADTGAMAAADALLRHALAWHEALPSHEREQPAVQRAIARALHDVGDLEAAAARFRALAGEVVEVTDCCAVHHVHLQAHLDHGYLGAIAIRLGDHDEARRIDALLERSRGDHLFGSTHYWRAAMAALRGDADAAAQLLRRAFARGMPYEPFIHADPHFATIRHASAFAAVLAPRG